MFAYAKSEWKQSQKNTVQKKETEIPVASPNLTGISDSMKTRFEGLSGFSFDDVRVHYNSGKPAQLQALAYTQNNQVYVGPGQEKYLGHELGHVVQQKSYTIQRMGADEKFPFDEFTSEHFNNGKHPNAKKFLKARDADGLIFNKLYNRQKKSTFEISKGISKMMTLFKLIKDKVVIEDIFLIVCTLLKKGENIYKDRLEYHTAYFAKKMADPEKNVITYHPENPLIVSESDVLSD